jgi:preprotein translocase subunit SecG
MNLVINLCLSIFVLVALLLVLVILMQRPKSEGLGAAFGAAVTENIFGAQTTNVLTRITAWLAGIFFVLTFVLAVLYAHKNTQNSGLRGELLKTQGATQTLPSPANPALSPSPAAGLSPVTSPAPDSGAGVLPAGKATPVPSLSIAEPGASPATTPKPKSKRNR